MWGDCRFCFLLRSKRKKGLFDVKSVSDFWEEKGGEQNIRNKESFESMWISAYLQVLPESLLVMKPST